MIIVVDGGDVMADGGDSDVHIIVTDASIAISAFIQAIRCVSRCSILVSRHSSFSPNASIEQSWLW